MSVLETRYAVPGWGVGRLWTRSGVVLAHDFRFGAQDEDEGGPEVHEPRSPGARIVGVDAHRGAPRVPFRAACLAASLGAPRVAPYEGAQSPPTGTVRDGRAPRGNGFVANSQNPRRDEPAVVPAADPGVIVERLVAFLAGRDVALGDIELDLSWCTPFQRALTETLRGVSRGELVSYGELAALAGYPGAQRAAGTFCARNRFAILVPCHRVVGADGIGGYGTAGVAVKRRLLALEGVHE